MSARTCSINGCDEPAKRRGWCAKHYKRWWKHGDPTYERPPRAKTCAIDGCDRPSRAAGYCHAHYKRWTRTGREPVGAVGAWTHGYVGTPTYYSWRAMIYRCSNPSAINWNDYGGRGVTVCERWRIFLGFLADMGERPEWATGGIDRIDPNGNYEPDNCRWATAGEQRRNQRGVRHAAGTRREHSGNMSGSRAS